MRLGIYLERKPESGGAYQYCLAMLKALSQIRNENLKIIAFCTYEDWKSVTEPLGIQTEMVQKNFLQRILHYLAEKMLTVEIYREKCSRFHPLSKRQKSLKIDCCLYPCGDKISFMLKTPAIVTVFDLMHRYLSDFPEVSNPKVYRSRERSYTNIGRYAKMILVDSEIGKQQMLECYADFGATAEKIGVLPYIAPDYVFESIGRKKYKKPDTFNKYIFYPAQFWKHKNHRNLLQAIVELKEEGITVNTVFCGSCKNAYGEVESFIRQKKLEQQVKVLGYVTNEEMVALYQYARALVMPTFGGPTNIPQLEAFVIGCPVATSDIFAIPEQVGEAALLFDPSDVSAIKECIKRLWMDDDLCEKLKQKGYEQSKKWGPVQFKETLKNIIEGIDVQRKFQA